MGYYHHGTLKKYTGALLDLFNKLEVQYLDSNGNTISKSIPVRYASREKAKVLLDNTTQQLLEGNDNVLPKANLSISAIARAETRMRNKNNKIGTLDGNSTINFMFNSVPYEFDFELAVMCRGMNEASIVIEQVAALFNPTCNIDIWDADNLDEPTRVPVKLLDIGIESEEYEELSSNIVTLSFGVSVTGNLYPPVQSIEKIQQLKMYLNNIDPSDSTKFERRSILGWDVIDTIVTPPGTQTELAYSTWTAPSITDITAATTTVGSNTLDAVYSDADAKFTELTFAWVILTDSTGSATIAGTLDTAVLTVTSAGSVEVQVTITDPFGNYTSFAKTFSLA